jgi:hypothetical protein
MADPTPTQFDLSQYPSELLVAVAHELAIDRQRIHCFLDALSHTEPGRWFGERRLPLPRPFLLGLGTALRLFGWEQAGISLHRDAGLPSAAVAMQDAFLAVTDADAAARMTELRRCVFVLSFGRMAWTGRAELGAEVVVGEADEEALLEGLADFLWAHGRD